MKVVLVTGASGFVGSMVLKALLKSDVLVHAVYLTTPPQPQYGVEWHRANLLDPAEVEELFQKIKPDYLIHLAWCTAQGEYWTDLSNIKWLSAGLHICKCFIENGGKRAVFGGTSAEYDWSGNLPLNELQTKLIPLKLYGGCKLSLYWAATRYFEQYKTDFAWVRFFNPFGEGEDPKRLIPKTCFRLLAGETIQFDAAASLRDFLHVEDTASAVVAVLESSYNGAVNIGSGVPVSVREVLETIADVYKIHDQLLFADPTPSAGLPDAVTADTTILNKVCGWKPTISFRDRMEQTCHWWKHQYSI